MNVHCRLLKQILILFILTCLCNFRVCVIPLFKLQAIKPRFHWAHFSLHFSLSMGQESENNYALIEWVNTNQMALERAGFEAKDLLAFVNIPNNKVNIPTLPKNMHFDKLAV